MVQLERASEVPQPSSRDYEFAVWIDVKSPVHDFHKRIPDMAYKVMYILYPGNGIQGSVYFVSQT